MSFINTKDLIGDEALANSIIDRSVVECCDDIISFVPELALKGCNNLAKVSFPNVKSIGKYAFSGCSALNTVDIPSVTKLDYEVFKDCNNLNTVSSSSLSEIGYQAFYNCSNLKTIDLTNVLSVGYESFYGCSNLISAYMPYATSLDTGSFSGCTNLTDVYIPHVTEITGQAFRYCQNLTTITLPSVTSIDYYAFQGCKSLTSIILPSHTMCTIDIGSYNPLEYTPIVDGTGYIYVPGSLVEQYVTDRNWSTYASQIKALDNYLYSIGNINIAYNSSRSIRIEYCAPDATPVITVASDNNSIATVGEVVLDGNFATFNVNALGTDGVANITVIMTIGDETFERTFIARVFETVPASTYSIEAIDGADYGFVLNSSNYYESQNNGVDNSYSICKVSFFSNGEDKLYLDCISYGQSYYDYGILSNIDTELAATYIVDADENIYKNFYGLSSADVQTVDYGVPEYGDHFIYVKYRKNNSTNSYNDSLQFKVRFATGGNAV